ncbi:MAG: virulence RhuM family protein, partial [Rhizobiaceae bacterium]|nr:virulence RhuM family protein [Rhizobiaceae bacterium]
DELEALNRIVTAYLEFAELQAMNRKPMAMRDWVGKLDDFLKLSDREVLTHAGRVTAEMAKLKGEQEFDRWHARAIEEPTAVERHFSEALVKTKALEKGVKRK